MTKETRKKGGRPKKSISEKRRYALLLKLNTIEHLTLKRKASEVGLNRNDLLREFILKGEVKACITIEQMKEIRALTSMANNLNQIAHRVNTFGLYSLNNSIKELDNIITNTLKEIRQ